jgi:hypothetical protein
VNLRVSFQLRHRCHCIFSDLLSLDYVDISVDQLSPGTHGHNIIAKVLASKIVVEKTRPDGSKIRIAECVIGDPSGCITFTARNGRVFFFKFNRYRPFFFF